MSWRSEWILCSINRLLGFVDFLLEKWILNGPTGNQIDFASEQGLEIFVETEELGEGALSVRAVKDDKEVHIALRAEVLPEDGPKGMKTHDMVGFAEFLNFDEVLLK